MSPRLPSPSNPARSRAPRPRRCPRLALAALLACSAFAGTALADGDAETANSQIEGAQRATRGAAVRIFTPARRRPALLPQTRYTVQKKIESIEPISWLERYGVVQVRRVQRVQRPKQARAKR